MTTSLKHPIRQMPFFSACKDTTILIINTLNLVGLLFLKMFFERMMK